MACTEALLRFMLTKENIYGFLKIQYTHPRLVRGANVYRWLEIYPVFRHILTSKYPNLTLSHIIFKFYKIFLLQWYFQKLKVKRLTMSSLLLFYLLAFILNKNFTKVYYHNDKTAIVLAVKILNMGIGYIII